MKKTSPDAQNRGASQQFLGGGRPADLFSPSLLELRAGLSYLSFLQPFQRPRQVDEADPGAILLAAEQHRRTGAVAHT